MISFLLTLRRFTRAIRHGMQDAGFRAVLGLVLLQLLLGTIFYSLVEGWRWLDALYFSVITLATVGYGDFTPKTDAGKIFTMIYIFTGIGQLVLLFQQIAENVVATSPEPRPHLGRRRGRPTDPQEPSADGAADPLVGAPNSAD